ncbi:MAG TPA: phosphatase PAP2 family protein [Gallionellaceae bacterium]|nr:phosphatase PAP2 family protein [Gallionellaceae bacterium]
MKEIFYDWGGLNVALFRLVNDIHGGVLDRLMLLATALGDHGNFPLYLSLLLLTGYVVVLRQVQADAQRRLALRWLAVLAVFSAGYVADGWLIGTLKPMLDFPRPPLALGDAAVHVVGEAEYHHSLPSGHSSFAMLLVSSLWPLLGRRGRVLGAAFVLWVGLSRISLGAHFPADVLAGYLLSLGVVTLLYLAVRQLGRRVA